MAWLVRARAHLRALDGWIFSARGTAALFALVFVTGLAVRLWIVVAVHPPGDHVYSDMWVYDHRAEHLLAWELDPWDSFTPVGYPALLAALRASFGEGNLAPSLANAFAGALTCGLVVLVCRRVTESGLGAALSGVFAVLHWPWLHYVGFLLSETWFTFLFMLAMWLLLGARELGGARRYCVAGLALGAAVTVRANAATVFLALPFLLFSGRFREKQAWREACAVALGAALPLALSALVYTSAAGRLTLAPTNGGLNFYLNFSDSKRVEYGASFIEPIPNSVRFHRVESVSVPFYEQSHYYARGLALLRDDPRRVERVLFNLRELTATARQSYWPGWEPLPLAGRVYGRIFFGFVIAPALLCAVQLLLRRRPEHGPARRFAARLLFTGAIAPVIYLGDPRLRVPFDAVLVILVLDGLLRLWRASDQEASAGSERTNAGAAAISP
jgi:hypothetical protein